MFDAIVAIEFRFSTIPPNLIRNGPKLGKWQPHSEIKDGVRRHLEILRISIFDVEVAFYIRFAAFPPNLVTIDAIVLKWQPTFEI